MWPPQGQRKKAGEVALESPAACSHCQVRDPAQVDAVSWHNSPFALKLKSVFLSLPFPLPSLLPPPDSCCPTREPRLAWSKARVSQHPLLLLLPLLLGTPTSTHQFSLGKKCGPCRRRGLGQTLTGQLQHSVSLLGDGLGVQTLMSQIG